MLRKATWFALGVVIMLFIFAVFAPLAHAAEAWPLNDRGDGSECAVLAANVQYGVEAVASGQHTLDEVVDHQAAQIGASFKEGKTIFTDEAQAKAFVEMMLRSFVKLVSDGKMPADGVGNVVMLNCQQAQHAARVKSMPKGIEPKGPQIES